jgi:hypothetical protein
MRVSKTKMGLFVAPIFVPLIYTVTSYFWSETLPEPNSFNDVFVLLMFVLVPTYVALLVLFLPPLIIANRFLVLTRFKVLVFGCGSGVIAMLIYRSTLSLYIKHYEINEVYWQLISGGLLGLVVATIYMKVSGIYRELSGSWKAPSKTDVAIVVAYLFVVSVSIQSLNVVYIPANTEDVTVYFEQYARAIPLHSEAGQAGFLFLPVSFFECSTWRSVGGVR